MIRFGMTVTATGAALILILHIARAAEPEHDIVDDSATQDRALAEALFRDGKSLADEGRIAEACAKFQESQRLDPALGTLLYLATCYSQAGRTASAWAAFQSAQELAHRRKDKAREAIARERAASLEPSLSMLQIAIAIPATGMQIRVDGRPLGPAALSTPLPFDPGTHTIEATAPGKREWSQSVELQPGPGTLAVRIPPFETAEPQKAAVEPPPKPVVMKIPAKVTSTSDGPRLAGFVSLGLGAVGLAAGSYFGIRAYSEAKDAEHHCSGSICDQSGLDGYSSARKAANISNIGFAVGIIGVAAGTYLVVQSPRGNNGTQAAFWVGGSVGRVAAGGNF